MLVIAMRCLDTKRDRVKRAVRTVERERRANDQHGVWGLAVRPLPTWYTAWLLLRTRRQGEFYSSVFANCSVCCSVVWSLLRCLFLSRVCLSVCLSQSGIVSKRGLTLYGLIKTAQQRTLYSNTVIGTLAVDGWAVTFGTARTGLGGLRPRPVPSSLYQM